MHSRRWPFRLNDSVVISKVRRTCESSGKKTLKDRDKRTTAISDRIKFFKENILILKNFFGLLKNRTLL